jgi:hypothetical protein
MPVAKEGEFRGSPFIRCVTDGTRNITPTSARTMVPSLIFMNLCSACCVAVRQGPKLSDVLLAVGVETGVGSVLSNRGVRIVTHNSCATQGVPSRSALKRKW